MGQFKLSIRERGRFVEIDVVEPQKSEEVIFSDVTDSQLLISSAHRKRAKKLAWAFYRDFREKLMSVGRALIHNIGNTELQIRQRIESHTRHLDKDIEYAERVIKLGEIIQKSPEKIAKDLLFLEQRSIELDAQLIGINLILGKGFDTNFKTKHPVESLMKRCISPSFKMLKSSGITINYHNLKQYELETDFRLFNCGMYHFLDNTQKYIKPDTELQISVLPDERTLEFAMCSCAIEYDELDRIFDEGFCGSNAKRLRGEGLGMFILAHVMEKMDIKMVIEPDVGSRLGLDGIMYQNNVFKIIFPEQFKKI